MCRGRENWLKSVLHHLAQIFPLRGSAADPVDHLPVVKMSRKPWTTPKASLCPSSTKTSEENSRHISNQKLECMFCGLIGVVPSKMRPTTRLFFQGSPVTPLAKSALNFDRLLVGSRVPDPVTGKNQPVPPRGMPLVDVWYAGDLLLLSRPTLTTRLLSLPLLGLHGEMK